VPKVYGDLVYRYHAHRDLCNNVIRQVMGELVSRPRNMKKQSHLEDKRLLQKRSEKLIAE
jgi:hypothetical protein